MLAQRLTGLASGIVAITFSSAVTAFLIIFAVCLSPTNRSITISATVAAILQLLSIGLVLIMVVGQFWPHLIRSSRSTFFMTMLVCFLSAIAVIVALSWMSADLVDLPATEGSASTRGMLYAAFVLWAISLVCQCMCLVCSLYKLRQSEMRSELSHTEEESHNSSEMQGRPHQRTPEGSRYEAMSPPSTAESGKKRSSSDTFKDLRASLSKAIRPINSKTRLVSLKGAYRSPSLDSGTGISEVPLEDAFDTWDIDPAIRQNLTVTFPFSSPPPPASSTTNSPHISSSGRFLETIPASPTGSRSNSPGFPQDLIPPRPINRSRSSSPATSVRSLPRPSRAASPSSFGSHTGITESHIHPLFRTDSPEPPPTTSSATVVTAAPGAGMIIADRQVIKRMRSGSLPTVPSPLIHSNGLTSEDRLSAAGGDERGPMTEEGTIGPPDREMTPTIPDWILNTGSRTRTHSYSRRKTAGPGGLGSVGEVGGN